MKSLLVLFSILGLLFMAAHAAHTQDRYDAGDNYGGYGMGPGMMGGYGMGPGMMGGYRGYRDYDSYGMGPGMTGGYGMGPGMMGGYRGYRDYDGYGMGPGMTGGYGMGPGMMGGYGGYDGYGMGPQVPRGAARGQENGRTLYNRYCAACHGIDGSGNGPMATSMSVPPANFTRGAFWKNVTDAQIEEVIRSGYGAMPPINLGPDQAKAIAEYMSRAFKR